MSDSDSEYSDTLTTTEAVNNLTDEMNAYFVWRDATKQRLNTIEGRLDALEPAPSDAASSASSGGTRRRRRKKRTRRRRKSRRKKRHKSKGRKRHRKKRTKRRR